MFKLKNLYHVLRSWRGIRADGKEWYIWHYSHVYHLIIDHKPVDDIEDEGEDALALVLGFQYGIAWKDRKEDSYAI